MTMMSRENDDEDSTMTRSSMLQEIASHLQIPDIDDTEILAHQFDVSPFRLWVIFQSVDFNGDGRVTKEELVECLASTEELKVTLDSQQLRQSLLGAGPFLHLWKLLVGGLESADQSISFSQFSRLIRYLWLQQLLNEDLDWKRIQGKEDYTFDCVDYAANFFDLTSVPARINAESRRFFTEPRHSRAKMRWIDVPSWSTKAVRITVLRLAVKYRFHPTSVEDVLEIELQQPKVTLFENSLLDLGDFNVESIDWIKYGGSIDDISSTEHSNQEKRVSVDSGVSEEDIIMKGQGKHYFVIIPMFELTQRSAEALERFRGSSGTLRDSVRGENDDVLVVDPVVIEIQEATVAMFVAADPERNLLVTVSSKWRPTRIRPIGEHPNYSETHANGKKAALEKVKLLLGKRYAIHRHRSADWLMHAIIDSVVDNLKPISKIYEVHLEYMSARLLKFGHRCSEQDVKEIIVMKRDLEWLYRELRPLQSIIRHIIDDKKIGVNIKHYLEDVEDHLNNMQEELESYARECDRMKDEYSSYQDRRMNDILYVLTLVTTLVVPAQLLTGYFGMNFENENGDLGSPLLNLGSIGLSLFWAITVVTTAAVALIMHRFGYLEKPRRG